MDQQCCCMPQVRPAWNRLWSKVLLSNKLGLCLINRKLALRIDGLSTPGALHATVNGSYSPSIVLLEPAFTFPRKICGN
jgi:hypothetical protein